MSRARESSKGHSFLLRLNQRFVEPTDDMKANSFSYTIRILLMSLIILHGSRLPVIRIGRIAGQYAKPRSKSTEVVDFPVLNGKEGETIEKEVNSFRGDNVNGFEVTDRDPDPERLLG